jgi:VWFA-related protein
LHRLFLNAQVSSSSGQLVDDVQAGDFTILEDLRPQKITSFQLVRGNSTGIRDRVILVLDGVNNSSGKLKRFRDDIERYLKIGNGLLAHSTSIAFVSERGVQIGAPSTNRATLLQELSQIAGNVHSSTCADVTSAIECGMPLTRNDNFSRSCDPNARLVCLNRLFNSSITALTSVAQEQIDGRGRVIVIWMGQGWPLLNQPGFIPDVTEVKDAFFRNLVTISNSLAEAQITLDVVGSSVELPVDPKHLHESFFFHGVTSEGEVTAEGLSLQALAYQSGGLVFRGSKDIAAQIAGCVADLDLYYSLAFDYSPASQFGKYHSLDVKLDKPGITVRTRTLYYAEP